MVDQTVMDGLYHFTESGLDRVWVEGVEALVDEEGDEVVVIPHVTLLHRLIVRALVSEQGAMTGPAVRFIRTAMGFTQAELGHLLHKEALTIGRWERGETPLDPNADTLMRLLARDRLGLVLDLSTEDMARRANGPPSEEPIIVRRTDLDQALRESLNAA